MDWNWLPQAAVTIIALGGLGVFWKIKFDSFDKRLDKFEQKIDYMRDAAADNKEATSVRLAKFDQHSAMFDLSRQEMEKIKEKSWELNAKVSKIFSLLDRRSIDEGVHKDK